MNSDQKRTWAEIYLDNLAHNYKEIKACLPGDCLLLATVKADAYGHGMLPVANELERLGVDYFSVACLDEAKRLRKNTVKPILILGCTPAEFTEDLIENDITQTVNSVRAAEEFSAQAVKCGSELKVHIAIDTGMSRLGLNCRENIDTIDEVKKVVSLPGIYAEGIFTHFAVSDEKSQDNDIFTQLQFERFENLILQLEKKYGIKFPIRHCANSGALINWEQTYNGIMNMVRPGIILYGLYPDKEKGRLELQPVMQLKTRIVQLQQLESGATVSYGRTWKSNEQRTIAVLPIGYADGFFRAHSNKLKVLVNGVHVPIVGRVCMDMTMVDVSDANNVKTGDIVTIFGEDNGVILPVEDVARSAGTISYEILCALSERVPRVYFRGND